jgi:aspartokinase
MTQRKTTIALKKIDSNFNKGYVLESLLQNYHLNVDLLKLICTKSEVKYCDADKKLKSIVNGLAKEIDENQKLKTIISKKNLKIVKVWVGKMDVFFKTLKYKYPTNCKTLFLETQKISGVLNISAHKIFSETAK